MKTDLDSLARIERLKQGDYQFGHAGRHRGNGSKDCPKTPHHHHDAFCQLPSFHELMQAGVDPNSFHAQSRR